MPRLKTRAKVSGCTHLLLPMLDFAKRGLTLTTQFVQVVSVSGDKVSLSMGMLGQQIVRLSDVQEL